MKLIEFIESYDTTLWLLKTIVNNNDQIQKVSLPECENKKNTMAKQKSQRMITLHRLKH